MSEKKRVEVNVEQIMEEIRRNIRMEEEMKQLPSFEDVPIRNDEKAVKDAPKEAVDWPTLSESLAYINRNYDIPYYWDFGSRGLKTFLKRVVRKISKCLVAPILAKQNMVNTHVVRVLNNLNAALQAAIHRADEQEKRIDQQAGREKENQRELTQLGERLEGQGRMLDEAREQANALRVQAEDSRRQLDELNSQTSENVSRLDQNDHRLDESEYRLGQSDQRLDESERRLAQSDQRLNESERRLAELETRLEAMQTIKERLDRQEQQLMKLDKRSDEFSCSVAKTILGYKRQIGIPEDVRPIVKTQASDDSSAETESNEKYTLLDYFKFQNTFRGLRSVIEDRQSIYVKYFKNCGAAVLDIGCGRGEFLHLMKENGIPAIGIDLYPEYVVEGELNGFDVRLGDGVEFLKNADTRFGGIFCGQVIEHISFEALQELCAAAYDKLLPGSYFIMETPNPMCVSTFTSSFYMDPTHNKPVHPLMLEYLLKEIGFSEVQPIFTDCSRVDFSLPKIDSDAIRNLDEVNAAIARVSEFLYGSLDYAMIAKKQ